MKKKKGKKNHELRVHFIGKTQDGALCRATPGMYSSLLRTNLPQEVTCMKCLAWFQADFTKLKEIQHRGLVK